MKEPVGLDKLSAVWPTTRACRKLWMDTSAFTI